MEKYISYKIQVSDEEQSIVLALLSDIGFESFIEESNSLEAFISESDYKVHKEIIDHYFSDNSYQFMINNHDPKDWNQLWESNFDDIIIKDKLHIRALFHPKRNDIETELIISPKMAFGTGHHATTFQIMAWMVDVDFENLDVLDFGCGTGILAIYAKLKKCKSIDLIDIESQAIDNVYDNLELNHLKADLIALGSTEQIPNKMYDVIFANITRNVISEVLAKLVNHLRPNGRIIFSGFLEQDKTYMEELFQSYQLKTIFESMKIDWLCIVCEKT